MKRHTWYYYLEFEKKDYKELSKINACDQKMKKDFKKLTIKVKEIKGICPVYKPGEKIVIDEGYKNIQQKMKT